MIVWRRTCKTLPASFPEYGLYQKNQNRGDLDIYTFLNSPLPLLPEFFRLVNLLLANKLLRLQILQNIVRLLQGFYTIFLAKFPDSSWLFGTQVHWLSVTLSRNVRCITLISVCNFQSMKSHVVELNGYLKFFCFITWFKNWKLLSM